MQKTFITERDVEDMARRGCMELVVDDNTVLTDVAYEKAIRLDFRIVQQHSQPPAAPIRPYLSQPTHLPVAVKQKLSALTANTQMDRELKTRVIEAVKIKLGDQVDGALLTTIVERVFADLGVS